MKTIQFVRDLFIFTAIVGIITACASDNYKKSEHTATALDEAAALGTKCNMLIDQSVAVLNELVSNPAPDLRKPFNNFNKTVEALSVAADEFAKKTDEVKAEGANYFQNWDKETIQIQNKDIRNRSEARKNDVAARFQLMAQHYDEANAAFRPFLSDLRDVQKFLSTDLTADGLAAIKDTVAKATRDAMAVKESLRKLSDEFQSLSLAMSPIEPLKQ
jgi:hypothetical protein